MADSSDTLLRCLASDRLQPLRRALVAIVWALGVTLGGPALHAQSAPPAAPPYAEAQRALADGDAVLARQRLQQWLQDHPDDAQARLLLGVALAATGDAAGAQREYETLTQRYPELPEPYNNLAVLHAAAGRLHEARTALEAAIRFHPDYATAHRNLGDVYAQLALGHWQRALALQPDAPGLGRRADALRQLLTTPPAAR